MIPREEKIFQSADYLKMRIGDRHPIAGIILGSGLGSLADRIENPFVIPYSEIPNFPVSTAVGHKGNLIFGTLGGKEVMCMQGRFHYYEGYTMDQVTICIRVMKLLGVEYLLASCACGGLNPSFRVGDIMAITDHINLLPNPLIGVNMESFGTRFPDMSHPYDEELIERGKKIAMENGFTLMTGVYVAGSGPSYETKAEYRYMRLIGGDAVAMSTVPEVIVARHCGMKVFGVSIITNASGDTEKADFVNDEQEVIKAADAAVVKMTALFTGLIATL
ncbi:MAG: purine-nucleoside phosphorylase [Bacteroidales bacterium]|nr:purine-nucleoside phosphorylase [Bacteroidales bacterium]MBR5399376.1 purine-nucleoside phosphorylase [Bacteroidales bacterium]